MATDRETKERLDRAVEKFTKLNEKRIRIDGDLARAEADLEKSKAEMTQRFGTDDPERIEAMIAEARATNEQAVEEFERSVDEIASRLAAIEQE